MRYAKRYCFRRYALFFALSIFVFISGCIGGGGDQPGNTQVVSNDLIKINKIEVSPASEIQTDSPFLVVLEVENVGQVPVKYLVDSDSTGGSVNSFNGDGVLVDYCNYLYKITDFSIVPKKQCDSEYTGACLMNLKPGETQLLQWKLKAPSDEDIVVGEHICDFSLYINYTSQAITTNYIYFASSQELSERQYSDKELALTGSNIATFGPMAISLKPAERQPISSDSNWTLYTTLKNFGTGIVEVRELHISMPNDFAKSELCDMDLFGQLGNTLSLLSTKKAKERKTIYKDKTSDLPCVLISPPKSAVPILTPYKFVANATYDYIMSQNVRIVTYSQKFRNIAGHN